MIIENDIKRFTAYASAVMSRGFLVCAVKNIRDIATEEELDIYKDVEKQMNRITSKYNEILSRIEAESESIDLYYTECKCMFFTTESKSYMYVKCNSSDDLVNASALYSLSDADTSFVCTAEFEYFSHNSDKVKHECIAYVRNNYEKIRNIFIKNTVNHTCADIDTCIRNAIPSIVNDCVEGRDICSSIEYETKLNEVTQGVVTKILTKYISDILHSDLAEMEKQFILTKLKCALTV